MKPIDPAILESYDKYERIEEAFQAALDESLNPRGPELLYEIVGRLGLPSTAKVLDLGCGKGKFATELAERFGLSVRGIDPVPLAIELSNQRLDAAVKQNPLLGELVRFELGSGDALPLDDASVDLIWCREVMVLIEDLSAVFAECRRVLRPQGRMLIYQNCRTDRLEPLEAELLAETGRFDHRRMEAAFTAAGFQTLESIDLGSEVGERIEEDTGEASRRLNHAARLMRDPQRYIAQFGQAAYDIMLSDCLWHVYRMIGKLSGRVYLLKAID